MAKKKKNHLDEKDIRKGTEKGLKKYNGLSFLEYFAMYMGVAQLLEISLKQLLSEKFGYDFEKTERWTLGYIVKELKKNGLRQDIFPLLDPVVTDRNYIAHDLLANHIVFHAILNAKKASYTKEMRNLIRATYQLEQVFFIIGYTNDNNGW